MIFLKNAYRCYLFEKYRLRLALVCARSVGVRLLPFCSFFITRRGEEEARRFDARDFRRNRRAECPCRRHCRQREQQEGENSKKGCADRLHIPFRVMKTT